MLLLSFHLWSFWCRCNWIRESMCRLWTLPVIDSRRHHFLCCPFHQVATVTISRWIQMFNWNCGWFVKSSWIQTSFYQNEYVLLSPCNFVVSPKWNCDPTLGENISQSQVKDFFTIQSYQLKSFFQAEELMMRFLKGSLNTVHWCEKYLNGNSSLFQSDVFL